MINWKEKLSSRKFWAAFIGFVSTLLIAFGVPNITIEQVIAVIGALSTLIIYILGESYVDGNRK